VSCVCVSLSVLGGCGGNEPKLVSNQTAVSNANAQGNGAQYGAPAKTAEPPKASMGDAINTSEYDARINRLEEESKARPKDEKARQGLAKAYLERGNALTQARQYQAALGDYRRTLRLDPKNEEAAYWSQTIIGILQQMNRPVPTEGAEPTPIKQ
jgi:tetratricopeptide (TPR) repeat protein